MDKELHGIFFRSIKIRRLNNEALDLGLVRAGEPEGLEVRHWEMIKKRPVNARQRPVSRRASAGNYLARIGIDAIETLKIDLSTQCTCPCSINFARVFSRHPREE